MIYPHLYYGSEDDVINADCITSRGYAARLHLGYDPIVLSLVCYRDG